jgi:Tfp pilus assembly protein PilF
VLPAQKLTPTSYRDAIGYFEQAVREEPDFALAYSGLSECYSVGCGAKQDLSLAEEYARKALALQPDLVEGHTSLGLVDHHLHKFADGEKELRQALKLDPNYMLAHHYYAGYLA